MTNKILLILVMLLTAIGFSQEQKTEFTLQEAIDYALENNRQANNATRDIEAAKQQKWETIATGLPQINGNISYTNNIKQQFPGIDFNGVTYWMGFGNFYRFSGQVETLPCTVRRFIFDDINQNYYTKVYAGTNSEFNEIIWLYPSGDGTECDKYVIYNPVDNYWVYGTMFFTTFADKEVFGNTITTGVTAAGNNIYNNEPVSVFVGANNETLSSFVESADFDIADGNAIMFMNRVIPDYEMVNGGKIKMKITTQQFPEASEEVTKEFDITNATQKVDFRSRGRQAKVRVSCDSNGTSWRWGSLRLALQGDGRR